MSTTTLTWSEEDRRKSAGALIASIVVHLLIILLVALGLSFRAPLFVRQVEEEPVELTLVAPPKFSPKQEPAYVETNESQRAEKPPEERVFESDKDTHAASPLPATGDAPIPTQDGQESPALSFENKEYT
ncbi:MAG: hypothetical protein WA376_05700, partial [Terrimicrobiaceae bacterium]